MVHCGALYPSLLAGPLLRPAARLGGAPYLGQICSILETRGLEAFRPTANIANRHADRGITVALVGLGELAII